MQISNLKNKEKKVAEKKAIKNNSIHVDPLFIIFFKHRNDEKKWQSPDVSVPKPGIEPGTFRSSV